MATGGDPFPPEEVGPVTSLKDCPHCGLLCLGPTTLSCGHILCRRCVHDVLEVFTPRCPRCEQPLRLPKDQDLDNCELIRQMGSDPVIADVVFKELENMEDVRCLNCPDTQAVKVCLDCREYYCKRCSANHLKARCCKLHTLHRLRQDSQTDSSTDSASCPTTSEASADSVPHPKDPQQSPGVSQGLSGDIKEWEKFLKEQVALLQQGSVDQEEYEATLNSIMSITQQLRERVNIHGQMLRTYEQMLQKLEFTEGEDPRSAVFTVRGSDGTEMKTDLESFKKRMRHIRECHSCPSADALKSIITRGGVGEKN